MTISTGSLWLEAKSKTSYSPLVKDMDFDVAIVGGGITGVTTAYLLSQSGLRVCLLEKDSVASGATGWTTAMIIQYVDTDFETLIDGFGKEVTKKIWDAGKVAIDIIEKNIRQEKIACEFVRCPYFVYAKNKKEEEALLAEQKAAKSLDIDLTFTKEDVLSISSYPSLVLSNQAKFHPVLYAEGLAKAASKNGVAIYEKTEVLEIDKEKKTLKTKNGLVTAKHIIVATYEPLGAPLSLYFKKGTYTTYMIVAKIKKGLFKEAMYQDSQNPYHYFRIDAQKEYDRIIIGGEDHRSQIPVSKEKSFKALETYLKTILKGESHTITHKWSGPILEPVDGLPSIGPLDDPHILYATGFSGTGMTYGTIAGMILSDLVLGKKNDFYEVFKTNRPLHPKALINKIWDYTEEFFGGVVKNMVK